MRMNGLLSYTDIYLLLHEFQNFEFEDIQDLEDIEEC